MNRMDQLCELLGLELGQKFKLKDKSNNNNICKNTYKIEKNGGYKKVADTWIYINNLLEYIFEGRFEIIYPSFKPNLNNAYWYVNENQLISVGIFTRDPFDLMCYVSGNCFKTKQEAMINKDRIINKFQQHYKEE